MEISMLVNIRMAKEVVLEFIHGQVDRSMLVNIRMAKNMVKVT